MDAVFGFFASFQDVVFSAVLFILGIIEILATYLSFVPLVQRKKQLEESLSSLESPEREIMQGHIYTYDKIFIMLRIIGVLLIALGLYGLTR